MARHLKSKAILLSSLAMIPLIAYGAIGLYASLSENLHPLPGGEAFRSGQLSYEKLQDTVARYKIRSILNLRGGNYDREWYQDEVILAKDLNITHIDYPLSSKYEMTDSQTQTLLHILETAPKPLLIHCNSGADRTGVVSALYVKYILKRPAEEAWNQLSWRFTHLRSSPSGENPTASGFERIANNPHLAIPTNLMKDTTP